MDALSWLLPVSGCQVPQMGRYKDRRRVSAPPLREAMSPICVPSSSPTVMRKHYCNLVFICGQWGQGHRNVPEWACWVHAILTNTLKTYIFGQNRDWVRKYKLTSRITQRKCLLKQLLHSSVLHTCCVTSILPNICIYVIILNSEGSMVSPYIQITTLIMQRILHLERTLRHLLAQCPIQHRNSFYHPWQSCNLYWNTSLSLVAVSCIMGCF